MRLAPTDICHRLFFALRPPAAEARAIGLLRDGLTFQSGVDNGRLHLTLGITRDFPEYPEEVAARMRAIGDVADGSPLTVVLDRMSGSAGSVALRPAHAIPGLRQFQRDLQSRLRGTGFAREGWSFSPHVTLGYRTGAPFQKAIAPIAWEAGDFVLIHSVVGHTIHNELGRWPLIPRQRSLLFG